MSDSQLEQLVEKAQSGDRPALEATVRQIQDQVYRLSIRMLVDPEQALAASQEILILVVTKLSTFQGKSRFRTWVYRVALNYLLQQKRAPQLSFEFFQNDLLDGLTEPEPRLAEDEALLNEVRVACTMAMLLCLDAEHRAAYVLGEILELGHEEASEIQGTSPANFRQRLSRARREVLEFTSKNCGLSNPEAACHCRKRIEPALAKNRIRPGSLVFSRGAPEFSEVTRKAQTLVGDLKALQLQKSGPLFHSPKDFGQQLSALLDTGN